LQNREKARKEKQGATEKQQEKWDKDFNKAKGRLWWKNPNAIHGGVAALHTELETTAAKNAEALRATDQQKNGLTLNNDIYVRRAKDAELERLFRYEPGRMRYLSRFDPELQKKFERWREKEAKLKEEAKIDPNKRYGNPQDDPRVQKLHSDVKAATDAEYQRQLEEGREGKGKWSRGIWYPDSNSGYQPPNRQAIEAEIRKGKLLGFANENPDLVRDYAGKDPELASAHKAREEMLRQKTNAQKLGEKRSLTDKLFRENGHGSDGLTLGQQKNPDNLIEPKVQSPPSPPAARPQPMHTSTAPDTSQPSPPSEQNGFRDRMRKRFGRAREHEPTQTASSTRPRFRSPTQAIRSRGRQAASNAGKAIDKRLGGAGSRFNSNLKNLRGKLPGGGKIPTNPEDAVKKAAKEAAKRAVMMPQLWITGGAGILIICILILILAISYALFGEPEDDELPPISPTPSPSIAPLTPPPAGTLTIAKTGPTSKKNGETIEYTITITGTGENITVVDRIFGGVEYVEAVPEPSDITSNSDNSLQSVTWNVVSSGSASITLTVKPKKNDTYIYNLAEITQ
jgi:hypothetical protein